MPHSFRPFLHFNFQDRNHPSLRLFHFFLCVCRCYSVVLLRNTTELANFDTFVFLTFLNCLCVWRVDSVSAWLRYLLSGVGRLSAISKQSKSTMHSVIISIKSTVITLVFLLTSPVYRQWSTGFVIGVELAEKLSLWRSRGLWMCKTWSSVCDGERGWIRT